MIPNDFLKVLLLVILGNSLSIAAQSQSTPQVIAWGSNSDGQTTVPANLTQVIALAAGSNFTLALKPNGSVVAWGNNAQGQTTVPSTALSGIIAIAVGGSHSLALKSDGSVIGWGNNTDGQSTVPATASSDVIAIAAGSLYSLALKSDGSVVAWGNNAQGQVTVPVAATSGVIAIAAWGQHVLALKTNGSVIAWGNNAQGQRTVPAFGNSDVIAIAAGEFHSALLKSNGSVGCWGSNAFGQTSVPASASADVINIAAGLSHTVILKSNGAVEAWGRNDSNQLTIPPLAGAGAIGIAAGGQHTVAFRADYLRVSAWGTFDHSSVLMPGAGYKAVALGNDGSTPHCAVLKTDGSVIVTGDNTFGQTDVPAAAGSGVKAIVSGTDHFLALKSDGSVIAWGNNSFGQTIVPASASSGIIAIAGGGFHSLALKSDGSVIAWGSNNFYGQANVPASASSGIIAIAAGYEFSAALKSDGSVIAWGRNLEGQTDIPASALSGVKAIAAYGNNHIRALKTNGSAVTTGSISSPFLSSTDIKAIAGNLALKTDGTLTPWVSVPAIPSDLSGVVGITTESGRPGALVFNSAPVISGSGVSVPYVEGGGGRQIIIFPSITDKDDINLFSATVSITGYTPGDTLQVTLPDGSGLTSSFDTSTGVLSIAGASSVFDDYITVIRSLRYHSTSEAPSLNNTLRSLRYVVYDGISYSTPLLQNIRVIPINDAPSFSRGLDIVVTEDALLQTFTGWATNLSAGPADEASQTLSFVVSNDNNALFSAQPSVNASGTLTFTPASGAVGMATVTIRVSDDGGTQNGGINQSQAETFTITINGVNDAPFFTKGTNVVVNEDAGTQTLAAWATAIAAGPSDESLQSVSFLISNDRNSLFTVQPFLDASGTLSFTPAPNAIGTATVTVILKDDGGTANGGLDESTQTFTITINPVNDAPSFTKGIDVVVNEDVPTVLEGWATNISAGPDESSQAVTFVSTNNNTSLFLAQPSVSSSGSLAFIPASNAFGIATVTVKAQDDGGVANVGIDQSDGVTFTITINPVNDAPGINPVSDISIPLYSDPVVVTLTGIHTGAAGEEGQQLTLQALSDNSLLLAEPQLSALQNGSATLTLTPYFEIAGTSIITLKLNDDGGTNQGGKDETILTFTFTVEDAIQPVFVPNLFSPNGNGTNEVFRVRGRAIAEIRFSVYNIYGQEVFSTTDVTQATQTGWDGTHNGKDQPAGTYTWTLSGKYTDGTSLIGGKNQYGQVVLIR